MSTGDLVTPSYARKNDPPVTGWLAQHDSLLDAPQFDARPWQLGGVALHVEGPAQYADGELHVAAVVHWSLAPHVCRSEAEHWVLPGAHDWCAQSLWPAPVCVLCQAFPAEPLASKTRLKLVT